MELLVALGDIYGAERLIPIASAHLSGVSYKTIGEGGLEFLNNLAREAKVRVPTTLNPSGMDRSQWREMGISARFADRQESIIRSYERLGVVSDCSCTPYLHTNVPEFGDHIAWAESNALSYANSVVGARTNREGGPGALAGAIIGKTPEYGLHLPENRSPTMVIEVDLEEVDYSLLGLAVGMVAGSKIPLIQGIRPSLDHLKTLGAAMAAAGSVAMFHVKGVTPEWKGHDLHGVERIAIGRAELESARVRVDTGKEPELIALGCPHLSVEEIQRMAARLDGRKKRGDAEVWFCTSRCTAVRCPREVAVLSRFGRVVCDTCMVVTPIEGMFSTTATNSGKACTYLPTLCSQKVVYRTTEGLLEMIS